MASPGLMDGVQRLAQSAAKAATASTSKVLASFTGSPKKPSEKRDKSEELANILDENTGFSSMVEAGSSEISIPTAQVVSTKPVTKILTAQIQKQAEVTRHKLMQMHKDAMAQRAFHLSNVLKQSKSSLAAATVCNDIATHLTEQPEAVEFYSKLNIIPNLLKEVVRCEKSPLRQKHVVPVRRCLALMGYAPPVKGPGVSILTLDGGGMKGLALIEVLKQLEKSVGRPLHQAFDYVMGVSTGGIVALLLFLLKTPLQQCEDLYLEMGTQMFSRPAVTGTSQLLLNHEFYDSKLWESILKTRMEGATFADYAGDPTVPKVAVISSVASESFLRPYLFRNYNAPCVKSAESSVYPLLSGSAKYKLWQGCRASSAAPVYFDEFKLDGVVHMDGGILANNPTAFAMHESSLLWPSEETNCVVSVGTGRIAEAWLPMIPSNISGAKKSTQQQESTDLSKKSLSDLAKSPTVRQKIVGFVQAATDTEVTHAILAGTLPKDKYFRLNPFLSEFVNLDECRPESLARVQADAQRYAELNEVKFATAAKTLNKSRPASRRLSDYARTRLIASTPMFSSSFSSFFAKANASKSNLKQKSQSMYGATQEKVSSTIAPVRKWMNA